MSNFIRFDTNGSIADGIKTTDKSKTFFNVLLYI